MTRFLFSSFTGLAAGLLMAECVQWWLASSASGRRVFLSFRRVPSAQAKRPLLYLAVAALGEELLFRGVLQPVMGVALASLVFGVFHVRFQEEAWRERAMCATVFGAFAGSLYAATGHLSAPVVAHVVVNYRNMRLLRARTHEVAAHHAQSVRRWTRGLASPPPFARMSTRVAGRVGSP